MLRLSQLQTQNHSPLQRQRKANSGYVFIIEEWQISKVVEKGDQSHLTIIQQTKMTKESPSCNFSNAQFFNNFDEFNEISSKQAYQSGQE